MSKKQPIQCSLCSQVFLRKNGGREKQCSLQCRFWAKVDCTKECWTWTASVFTQTGYGQFALTPRKPVNAHRMSWELSFGDIPSGMYVLHKCDNRSCVRPDHLFLGTQKDNMVDMSNKGRHVGTLGHRWTPERRAARSAMMKAVWAERKAA
jgi:hypothetical protein